MIRPTSTTIRLFLHVVAACIWVGGQFTLAGLVGPLRRQVPEATKVAARAFNRIAWPAFGVLVLTGIWNLAVLDMNRDGQSVRDQDHPARRLRAILCAGAAT